MMSPLTSPETTAACQVDVFASEKLVATQRRRHEFVHGLSDESMYLQNGIVQVTGAHRATVVCEVAFHQLQLTSEHLHWPGVPGSEAGAQNSRRLDIPNDNRLLKIIVIRS